MASWLWLGGSAVNVPARECGRYGWADLGKSMTKAASDPDIATKKQRGGFQKGQSGNPAGKPKGLRSRRIQMLQDLVDGQSEALVTSAINRAIAGDGVALRLCVERIFPARKDAPISVEIPTLTDIQSVAAASRSVVEQVAAGDLSPVEGTAMVDLLAKHKTILEASELEARIEALEARAGT